MPCDNSTYFNALLFSQDVPVGQWKDYLAYNQPSDICVAKERVYCVAQGGLFYYNNDDNSINREYQKLMGFLITA